MNYIIRNKSVITSKENLEPLYTFKNFPVFFGCVDHDSREDVRADMSLQYAPKQALFKLTNCFPLRCCIKRSIWTEPDPLGRHFIRISQSTSQNSLQRKFWKSAEEKEHWEKSLLRKRTIPYGQL